MQVVDVPGIGQIAPDLRLQGEGGQFFTLSEYRGRKNVVLVFYPLAFSPVCSHQLPIMQKELETLRQLDAEVFGVSVDSHYANTAFARQLGLSFPLLSDFKHEASHAYGVFNPEKRYSRRVVFVIDKQGRIAYRDEAVPGSGVDGIPRVDSIVEALTRLS